MSAWFSAMKGMIKETLRTTSHDDYDYDYDFMAHPGINSDKILKRKKRQDAKVSGFGNVWVRAQWLR
jgi:hypothetical protein